MDIVKTDIDGVYIIEPRVFDDDRGYFFESFNKREFEEKIGRRVNFVQDNESYSSYGVVRGLHFQKPPYAQAKLVRCTEGKVLDVAVDLRKGSPTYGKHVSVELSDENKRQLFIPRGFAHGFSVLSEKAKFQYKCDNFYNKESESGLNLKDGDIGIDWRIPLDSMILSDKDVTWGNMADLESPFDMIDKPLFKKLIEAHMRDGKRILPPFYLKGKS